MTSTFIKQTSLICNALGQFPRVICSLISSYTGLKVIVIVPYSIHDNGEGTQANESHVCTPIDPTQPITSYTMGHNPNRYYDLTIVGNLSFRGLIIGDQMIHRMLPSVSFDKSEIREHDAELYADNIDGSTPEIGSVMKRQYTIIKNNCQLFHRGPKIVKVSDDRKTWSMLDLHSIDTGMAIYTHCMDIKTNINASHTITSNTNNGVDNNDNDTNENIILLTNFGQRKLQTKFSLARLAVTTKEGIMFIVHDSVFYTTRVSVNDMGIWTNYDVLNGPMMTMNWKACVYVWRMGLILLIGYHYVKGDPKLVIVSISASVSPQKSMNINFMDHNNIPILDIIPFGAAYDDEDHRLYIISNHVYSISLHKKAYTEVGNTWLKEWSLDSPAFYPREPLCAAKIVTLS
jgi:hypothetical protein